MYEECKMKKNLDQKINKTTLLAVTLVLVLATSLIPTISSGQFQPLQLWSESDYRHVYGVLGNDTYSLYPFEKKSTQIGFSKYGELMNPYVPVGLNYSGAIDPFANSFVARQDWNEGWVLNCTYVQAGQYKNVWAFALYSDTLGSGTPPDLDWQHVTSGFSQPYCGRKTNAYAKSYPIEKIYDGPRKAVYRLKTVISTNTTVQGFEDDKILELTFHVIFEKDKKYVIWIKDIKRVDIGKGIGTMQIEFSERGQWDMERASHPLAYAHWFVNQSSEYNKHIFYNGSYTYHSDAKAAGYDVCQIISKSLPYVGWAAFWPNTTVNYVEAFDVTTVQTRLSTLSTAHDYYQVQYWPSDYKVASLRRYEPLKTPIEYPRGEGRWSNEPMVFVNNVAKTKGTHYEWVYNSTRGRWGVEFYPAHNPSSTDYLRIVYKSTQGVLQSDMSPAPHEPATPYVIGEWAFDLTWANVTRSTNQFRCVTVYGVTDIHDASDADQYGHHPDSQYDSENVLDREVRFQLNEVFNPWDLNDAVHKDFDRWVYKTTLTSSTYKITVTDGIVWNSTSCLAPYYMLRKWGGTSGSVGWSYTYSHSEHWSAKLDNTGGTSVALRMRIDRPFYKLDGDNETALYWWQRSTWNPTTSGLEKIRLLVDMNGDGVYNTTGNSPDYYIESVAKYWDSYVSGQWKRVRPSGYNDGNSPNHNSHYESGTNCTDWHTGFTWQIQYANGSSNSKLKIHGLNNTRKHTFECLKQHGFANDQILFAEIVLQGDLETYGTIYIDDVYIDGIRYDMESGKMVPDTWDEYCEVPERVLVNGTLWARYGYQDLDPSKAGTGVYRDYYTIDFSNGTIWFWRYNSLTSQYELLTLKPGTTIKVLYSTDAYDNEYKYEYNDPYRDVGRYEWSVVGTCSAAIDSTGASMVTSAFQEWKYIEVYKSALELKEATWGPYAPYVLREVTTADRTRSHYRDSINRLHLKDDWCSTLPISSSNIIVVGGPAANGLSEYFNDYTDAFLIKSDVSTSELTGNGIYGPGCWNKTRAYYGGASGASGYAVISTYKDLNGTIGFIVWGYDGQDTYYAAYALRHGLIAYLQYLQPGVTTLILKITYTTHPVTISIVECLGIFTECTGFGHIKYLGEGGATYVRTNFVLVLARRLGIEHKLMSFSWPPSIHADP